MIEDYVHPDQRQNFCFHAHQIFHGNGVFNVLAQTSAASACLISIQRFMSHFPEEVTTVVYENHDQEKKSIRQTHNFLKDGANTEVMREQISDWSELLPMSILMLRDSIRRG
jgi:hypothetical protein